MADFPELRLQLAEMHAALTKERYLHYAGHKASYDLAAIYRRYGFLCSEDLCRAVRERRDAATEADERRTLGLLYREVVILWLGMRTQEVDAERAALEARLSAEVDGERIPYRRFPILIANEPDRERRSVLRAAKRQLEAEVLPLHRRHWELGFEAARELGYPDYLAMTADLTGVDYPHLNAQLQTMLARTTPIFERTFEPLFQDRIGCGLREAESSDALFVMREPGLDAMVRAESMVPALEAFTAGLGLPLAEQRAIHLDLEARPGKVPRAFCSPVKMGEEIYVTLSPGGGLNDLTTLFHETGHAYHFAYTDPAILIEEQITGDRAVSEGFAFLFNFLPEDPAWLQRYLAPEDPEAIAAAVLRRKLWQVRRYAAKLNYELTLLASPALEEYDTLYQQNLDEALLVTHDPIQWLIDLDSTLYAADYLRAWIWEVQLREHLASQHGPEWWASPDTAPTLIDLWKLGRGYMADDLAQRIGLPGLDQEPLIRRFEQMA